MAKNLVIVESPAKAKTIEKFLGKDYQVLSCFGHIRDLPKSQISIDIEHGFEPKYEISADKKKVISDLVKSAKTAEMVWLASDEDREGEAIAWHLEQVLKLEPQKTKRIVFNEITKTAILHAIENPRSLDYNLVDAQQARRVLDRLVGYEISPILWRKVRPQLSAGRVQSVAVRLVVDREESIKTFEETSAFKVVGNFSSQKTDSPFSVEAELDTRFVQKEEAKSFLEACTKASYKVSSIETKPSKKSPAPPFTTSTLQQEASRKLGFSVTKTMYVAQQLYEQGLISYMRTDSVNLSNLALNMAKEQIVASYGAQYVKTRHYATKTKGAQEAHEAIRPAYMDRTSITGEAALVRLYDLIWKRTIASQMSDAELEKTQVLISVSNRSENFIAKGEVLLFDGFLKVYMESLDDEDLTQKRNEEGMLPPIKNGEILQLNQAQSREVFTQRPPRYSEASLVKKMEELGIGRPSTYAPTIATILKREYIVKEDRDGYMRPYIQLELNQNKITETNLEEKTGFEKSKLFPTDIGSLVNQFLMDNFNSIVDFNFTAQVEKEFDEVAQGLQKWDKMISDFYHPFHKQVDIAQNSERVSGERLLGIDPKTAQNIYVKISRFGPVAQMGETNSDVKPTFAGLKKGQSIESLTLEDALELFKLPRVIGLFEDKEMVAGIGRFGPYIRHNSLFISIPKTDDPLEITETRAIEVIQAKRKADAEKIIKIFQEQDIQVLNGRFGPYIVYKKQNYKIPKNTDAISLTLDDCLKLIEVGPTSASRSSFRKGAKTTSTSKSEEKKVKAKTTASKTKVAATKKTAKTTKTSTTKAKASTAKAKASTAKATSKKTNTTKKES
ncbi:MAG: type I DNA topoisomerase [Bacteroidales bacterium]